MDLATLAWLRSAEGAATLAELAGRALAPADALREVERLRRAVGPERARAAIELALLRRHALAKFPDAGQLFFTREALEQASAAPVAAHRARRMADHAPAELADLGCGIGGDALAFARAGLPVTAVDRDPLRLALAEANAEACGLAGRISLLQRDLLAEPPPPAGALFCDPGRRAGGRRRHDPAAYEPPLPLVLGWRAQTPALAAKLAPGIDRAALPADAELEFVSLDGELKEAVLWCGPLALVARRASVLRGHEHHELASPDPASPAAPQAPPAAFIYEPDPAVIRAGLVAELAEQLGAAQIDPQIAYLTAPGLTPTPLARAWPLITWLPFSLKGLRARLRELGAGAVTVKKRGSPLDSDALARQLSRDGGRPLVVFLTRVADRPAALICAEPTASRPDLSGGA